MDISKIVGNIGALGTKPQTGKGTEKGFGKILDEAMNHACGVAEKETEEVSCPNSLSAPHAIDPLQSPSGTLQQAEKILSLMDRYANALGDPERTLKSIEPIVREIQAEVDDLPPDTASRGGGLKNVINDIAVMASVEALKFHRGDYVS